MCGKYRLLCLCLTTWLCSEYGIVLAERTIASSKVTNWGTWGNWEYCPSGHFVTGMQLYSHPPQGSFRDDRGLTGIRLFCNTLEGTISDKHIIHSSTDDVGKWGKKLFCSSGFMTGFQMRNEPYQGMFGDDTAANNVRMYCDGRTDDYKQGDGTNFGKWHLDKKLCGSHEAVCGIITQIDKTGSWDRTGLNNVIMKCCNLPHPIGTCMPVTKWEYVMSCSNPPPATTPKTCTFSRNIGVGYSNMNADTKVFFDKANLGLQQMIPKFQAKILGLSQIINEDKPHGKDLKFENIDLNSIWRYAPSYVWQPEFSYTRKLHAKSETKVTIYQLQASCALMHVWGTKLKKVEENLKTKQVSVTYFDDEDDLDLDF